MKLDEEIIKKLSNTVLMDTYFALIGRERCEDDDKNTDDLRKEILKRLDNKPERNAESGEMTSYSFFDDEVQVIVLNKYNELDREETLDKAIDLLKINR